MGIASVYEPSTVDVLCVGFSCCDLSMHVTHHPESDEKMRAIDMNMTGGGPASNASIAVSRLGGVSEYIGYLGFDQFGEQIAEELKDNEVCIRHVVRGERPTPIVSVIVKPNGDRSCIDYRCKTPWIKQKIKLNVEPHAILFDGHEPIVSEQLLKYARKKRIPTVLDAGSMHAGTSMLMRDVSWLVTSEKFAIQATHTKDPKDMISRLSVINKNVIVTLGDRGVIWHENGKMGSMKAFDIEGSIVDSTGAGDAFHGAFTLQIIRKAKVAEAIMYASAVGAITCTKRGGRSSFPYGSDVINFTSKFEHLPEIKYEDL